MEKGFKSKRFESANPALDASAWPDRFSFVFGMIGVGFEWIGLFICLSGSCFRRDVFGPLLKWHSPDRIVVRSDPSPADVMPMVAQLC